MEEDSGSRRPGGLRFRLQADGEWRQEMPLIVATWPNKSVSVVAIHEGYTLSELFRELDSVSDPYCVVSMFEVPMRYGVLIDTDEEDGAVRVTELNDYLIKEITHMGFKWPSLVAE
jgi:hypothetical protein